MTDKKYDTGKPMVGLMKKDFALALIAVAEVTSYGVKKYNQPGSWRTVENALDRYEDALGRHDLQGANELRCAESGLTHLAHRAWNALATLQLALEEHPEFISVDRGDKRLSAIAVLSKSIPDTYAGLKGRFPDNDAENVYTWVCSNCGVRNDNSNIYTCQRCGHKRS